MQHQLHAADTHSAEFETADVEGVEGDLVAFADLAQQIFQRRFRIREHQRCCARTLDAHLVLFRSWRQSFLSLDDEGGEFVAINFREHDKDVGKAAVGDEHLFAVKNVMRAVFAQPRRRFCSHRVGTGPCLGKRVRCDHFTGCDLRQVLLFRCFGAEINDRQQTNAALGAKRSGE